MHFDLPTLYSLAVGTLILSAAMTLWERQARPQRSAEMRMLAAGYSMLAIGCAIAVVRGALPGVSGAAISNLAILLGYLLVLDGVAGFGGHHHRLLSTGLFAFQTLAWALAGSRWPEAMWEFFSAFPIAVASGIATWETWRGNSLRHLRARNVVLAVTGSHAVVYAGRAFLLPLLVAAYGPDILAVAGKLTMYDGVLYSVGLPMAMLALIREEAHDRLLAVSRTDYLTGIGNRQWFFEECARLIAADARRAIPRPMSVLAFDLDHFKAINDSFGHATGDEVLRGFAKIAQRIMGKDVILARMGGEEFAALLPGYDILCAKAVGQAVSRCLSEARIEGGHTSRRVTATVSVGVAERSAEAPDLETLLLAADRALYMAKALGRNRTELAASQGAGRGSAGRRLTAA